MATCLFYSLSGNYSPPRGRDIPRQEDPLAELVDHEAGAELGLVLWLPRLTRQPGGLRGHDIAGVGNVDNLLHAHGIEGEGDLHLAVVDADGLRIYSENGRIVIEGAEGETVAIYNMMGRNVRNANLPAGIYMLKIGNHPARKMAVLR